MPATMAPGFIPFTHSVPEADRRAYRIDAIAAAYYGWFIGLFLPFIPVLLKRMGATPLELGMAIGAPYIALLIAFPMLSRLRGFRALDIVTLPAVVTRLAVAGVGWMHDTTSILAIFVVGQIVEGLGMSPYARVMKAAYTDSGRSVAMGYVRACLAANQILATALGGMMLDLGFERLPFVLSALCGAVSSLTFWHVIPRHLSPALPAATHGVADVRRAFSASPGFFWMNATIMVFGFGNLLLFAVLPTLLVERFHITNTQLGGLNALQMVTQMLSYVVLGRFIARSGPLNGMFLSLSASVANPWLVLMAPSVAFLAVPYTFNGIMAASYDLAWMQLIMAQAPEEKISSFAGIFTFLMGVRGIVATFLANLAMPYWGAQVFLMVGGCFTTTGLLIGLASRRRWLPPPVPITPVTPLGGVEENRSAAA